MSEAAPDIFLSYNREDAAVAQTYRDAFEREGFEVWWDATLRSGEAYDKVTEAALRGAKAVVVLWSPRSVESRWVRAEATIAERRGTLMPATIEPCDRPVMFELTQTAELSHWRGDAKDKAWRAFLDDVRRMVARRNERPIESNVASAPAPDSPGTGAGMPIVAVLPITHRGSDDDMEILAEDLTEDITRELGQSPYCKVIAVSTMAAWRGKPIDHQAIGRELKARYLIEGKLQRAGESARLTMQLIDIGSDNMLWSSRFVRSFAELPAATEELPRTVAADLSQTIGQFEMNRALAKRAPCSSWEYMLRARVYMRRNSPGNAAKALEEARKAVSAGPDDALAYATLANALSGRLGVDRLLLSDSDVRDIMRESHDAITRAMELGGDNPDVLTMLAQAYGALGDAEAGLRIAQRATRLAPGFAEAQFAVGFSHFILGRTSEAIAALSMQDSIGLTDNARMMGLAILGVCLFIEGRSAEAEEAIDRSLTLQPDQYLALRWKAIIAAEQGKEQSARAAVRLLRKGEPGKSIDEYLDSPKHLPIEHERKYEGIAILRKLLEETEGDA